MEMQLAGNYGEVRDGQLYGPGSRGVMDHAALAGFGKAGTQRKRKVNEAMRLYLDVLGGRTDPILIREALYPQNEFVVREVAKRYPGLYGDPGGRQMGLRETMSVTDYQALYVDVLDRLYYGYYNDFPVDALQLVKSHEPA